MYKLDTKNIKKGMLFYLPFLLMGLLFFAVFGWLAFGGMITKAKLDGKIKATKIDTNCNTNSDGEYMCSPIYYYNVDGEEYECRVSFSSNIEVSGKQNMVYYDTKKPDSCVTDYTASPAWYMYLFSLFPLIFVFVGAKGIWGVKKKLDDIKKLSRYGKLIKGLKYTLEDTGISVNGVNIVAPAVDYTMSNGTVIHLIGDPRHDRKVLDEDGFVDLLIDEMNPDNYFIDFEIK